MDALVFSRHDAAALQTHIPSKAGHGCAPTLSLVPAPAMPVPATLAVTVLSLHQLLTAPRQAPSEVLLEYPLTDIASNIQVLLPHSP